MSDFAPHLGIGIEDCIGCGAAFWPPNGTELCPLCCPTDVSPASPPPG